MATVTISGTAYEVYQSTADVTKYLQAASHAATAWTAVSSGNKDLANVTATRLLDRQSWLGTKTDSGQALQWPRSGVTFKDGSVPDPAEIPVDVLSAHAELAFIISQNPSGIQQQESQDNDKRAVRAGSVSVEYFYKNPTGKRFPTILMELVGHWLTTYSSGLGGFEQVLRCDDDDEIGGLNRSF